MPGITASNFFKNDVSIANRFPEVHKHGIHAHTHTHTDTHTQRQTHTHTHDDSIRRNAMRCISPKNELYCSLFTTNRLAWSTNFLVYYRPLLTDVI